MQKIDDFLLEKILDRYVKFKHQVSEFLDLVSATESFDGEHHDGVGVKENHDCLCINRDKAVCALICHEHKLCFLFV